MELNVRQVCDCYKSVCLMYKEHCNTTMALVASQHNCLGWLDDDVDFVRVLSSDFSKAFDALSKNSL